MTGARVDPDVRHAIESFLARGWTPTSVLRMLEGDRQFAGRTPSLRTVTSMKAGLSPDRSGTWSPFLAEPDEAALVMPVLVDLVRGEVLTSITRATARCIARVRLLAPHLEVGEVLRWAGAYLVAGEDPADVDLEFARWLARRA
jgi:hypothetical protein